MRGYKLTPPPPRKASCSKPAFRVVTASPVASCRRPSPTTFGPTKAMALAFSLGRLIRGAPTAKWVKWNEILFGHAGAVGGRVEVGESVDIGRGLLGCRCAHARRGSFSHLSRNGMGFAE